ncbi:hypothetical protein BVH03_02030 [Pseudomonas sp. PA15(2017)]|nr:hypothetical protein BVH03_02030 [Pseudomonas sp. PA15(2017)]
MSSGPIEVYLLGTWSIPPDALRRSAPHKARAPDSGRRRPCAGAHGKGIGKVFSISPHLPAQHRLIATVIRRIITITDIAIRQASLHEA